MKNGSSSTKVLAVSAPHRSSVETPAISLGSLVKHSLVGRDRIPVSLRVGLWAMVQSFSTPVFNTSQPFPIHLPGSGCSQQLQIMTSIRNPGMREGIPRIQHRLVEPGNGWREYEAVRQGGYLWSLYFISLSSATEQIIVSSLTNHLFCDKAL